MGDLNDRQYGSHVKNLTSGTNSGINTVFGVVGAGKYTAADPTLTDEQFGFFRVTSSGELMTSTTNLAYETATDSNKVFEINPISEHHTEETLADVTNGTAGTYDYHVDMDGFRTFALQYSLSGTSGITVLASLQDDGTAVASCLFTDVTNTWFGSGSFATSSGTSGIIQRDVPTCVKYLRFEVDATDGNSLADWALYFKKLY